MASRRTKTISIDALIGIGAVIATPADATRAAWHDIAEAAGARLTDKVIQEIADRISVVREALSSDGVSDAIVDDVLGSVEKMQNRPRPKQAHKTASKRKGSTRRKPRG